MIELASRSELLQQTLDWQQQVVALIPTMGNLHNGHLSLIKIARRHADTVVVSVFVNPTQFGANEDFSNYPRSLESDRKQLLNAGCDVLFAPSPEVLYPFGSDDFTQVLPPIALANTLCGLARPGHFNGVLSVVARLFNLIQPQVAVFGEKDFQQLLIIKRMVTDLGMSQQIISAPTIREPSGLAMSSRNQHLDTTAKQQAMGLQQTLQHTARQLDQGRRDIKLLEDQAFQQLQHAGFQTEYFSIRLADDLSEVSNHNKLGQLRILAAVKLGRTRLIDNIAWPVSGQQCGKSATID